MASSEASVLQHKHDHIHVDSDHCPWCDQPITHEKFKEIQSRIQREERERATAVEQRLKRDQEAALKAKDVEREQAVEAARKAEQLAATERVSAVRAAAIKETEGALTKRLSEADGRAKTAEGQVKQLSDAAKAAEKAAVEREVAVRKEATDKVTETLDKKVADAEVRANSAETKLKDQAAEQKRLSDERLKTELGKASEVYEKDVAEKIAEVRAGEFEKSQKLQTKADALQRELNKKTSNEIGEGEEIKLFDVLRDRFPGDTIERIQKGEPGVDIRHEVHQDGQFCGLIVYDSKARKAWQYDFANKLRDDQMAARADHAILSSFKFPSGEDQICEVNEVIVANPARVVAVVEILRRDVVRSHRLKISSEDRAKKSTKLYDFITGEQFVQKLSRVDELAGELLKIDEKEIQAHKKVWERRGAKERAIQKANTDLRVEVDSILEG